MEADRSTWTEEDPKHVVFRFDPWLATFPLTENSAMEYFSLSPFYDHTCTNEGLRAQGMRMDDGEALKERTGMEYVVMAAKPPHLFAIAKRKRTSPHKTNIVAMYYILDGNVYQAPTLRDVISSRTVRRKTRMRRGKEGAVRCKGVKKEGLTIESVRIRQERALFNLREAFALLQEELDLDGKEGDGEMEERVLHAMEEPRSEHDVEERARFQRTMLAVLRKHPVSWEPNEEQLQVQKRVQEQTLDEGREGTAKGID